MFIPPSNPGATLDIPIGSTTGQISALRYYHITAAVLFDEYDRTEKSLRQQLLSAIDELFVRFICHRCVGYGTVTMSNILDNLYKTYADISPSNLQENETRFRDPYNANHPIDTLIDQLKTAVEYLAAVNTPYLPSQVVVTAYQLIL